jgi:serine/threonine protein kinase
MVHRDVKPYNILLTADGQAKLADLGLVKELETDLNLTRTGRGLGTPHFMAPEQFRNAKNADARCDIYSMAATLYMMVTGELPFKSCGPLDAWMKKIHNELTAARTLVPSLSERTDWAIRRAMSADPNQRPASCREFIEDLTGHSTRRLTPMETGTGVSKDLWFLVFKDEDGVLHTVKGSTPGIRQSLKEGRLGDAGNVRASRAKSGPFELLRNHAEFRDLVVEPAPAAVPAAAAAVPPTVAVPVPPSAALARPASREKPVNREKRPPTPPAVTVPTSSGPMPHIDLGTDNSKPHWVVWLGVFILALGAGLIYLFWPLIGHSLL